MKFFRSFRLPIAGLAVIAALSSCGNDGNLVAPTPELDTTPPPAPHNLTLAADASGLPVLIWAASAAPDVAGYAVFVLAPVAGGGEDYVLAGEISGNSFTLPIVTSPLEASYRVRAVDAASNWSAFSTAAEIVIPVRGGPLDIE